MVRESDMASADKQELLGQCPVPVLQALDALAQANGGMDRTSYVNVVLEKHVREEAHKASQLVKMMRGNPLLPDAFGVAAE